MCGALTEKERGGYLTASALKRRGGTRNDSAREKREEWTAKLALRAL